MRRRSSLLEWMDLGELYYTQELYQDCLKQLDRVGQLLGGDRATFKAIQKSGVSPRSILDVGCGGGGFTRKLALAYPQAEVLGIDLSSQAIAYAQAENNPLNVSFACQPLGVLSKRFDLVVTTLVCHHLQEDALVDFIKSAKKLAGKALIVNDLHRHWVSWIGFALLAPPLFRNKMITHDGLLSIRKGFTKREWVDLFQQAQIKHYAISWRWPFRWTITLPAT